MLRPLSRRPRWLALASALAIVSACDDGTTAGDDDDDAAAPDAGPDASPPPACPGFGRLSISGTIATSDVELSGLAASANHADVLWSHNDDPGPAELLAFATDGRELADVTLDTRVSDLEDVFRVPGGAGGPDLLYLADTGDNDLVRATVRVVRVAEPDVTTADSDRSFAVTGAEVFTLAYPDGPHDAEAIAIEPGTGDLYIFTKASDLDDVTRLYRSPGLATSAPGGTRLLEFVLDEGDAPGLRGAIVAASLSPDASMLLLGFRHASAFRLFPLAGTIAATVRTTACQTPAASGQVEGVTFAADDSGYFMVAEGPAPDLTFVALDP